MRSQEEIDLIFSPKIDATSEQLAKIKNSNANTFNRLYNYYTIKQRNINELDKSLRPSFTPRINKCPSYVNPNKFYQSKSKIFFFKWSLAKQIFAMPDSYGLDSASVQSPVRKEKFFNQDKLLLFLRSSRSLKIGFFLEKGTLNSIKYT